MARYMLVQDTESNTLLKCDSDDAFEWLDGIINDPEVFDTVGWEVDERTAWYLIDRPDTECLGMAELGTPDGLMTFRQGVTQYMLD